MTIHEKRLARFILRIKTDQDTPDLIMIIAEDANHLRACRSIVDPPAESNGVSASTLQRICSQYGWQLDDLKEKLLPAAKALGIIPPHNASDHYQVLGVPGKATPKEIKQAFRNQAFKLHPDTASDLPKGHEPFYNLLEAYHTLHDPARRRFYDADRKPRWREYSARLLSNDGRAAVYRWYLTGLIIIFIILLLLTIIISQS